MLARCDPAIDLEALAHHRGSAFGHHPQPQPSQVDFENALSIALLKQVAAGNTPFAVEDESRNIGSRHVPPVLYEAMQSAPLVLLEAADDERTQTDLAPSQVLMIEMVSTLGMGALFLVMGLMADYSRGASLKFAIVVSRFNSFITDRLLEGAIDAIRRTGGEDPADRTLVTVDGVGGCQPRYGRVAQGELVGADQFIGLEAVAHLVQARQHDLQPGVAALWVADDQQSGAPGNADLQA